MVEKERTIIVREKSDNGALKVATLVAIVATSPFWFVLAVVLIGCIAGVVSDGGPWPYLVLLVVCLMPAVRDRMSGKYDSRKLQERIEQLEAEAADTGLQLLHLHETIDFDHKLKVGSQDKATTTGGATPAKLVEVGNRSDN